MVQDVVIASSALDHLSMVEPSALGIPGLDVRTVSHQGEHRFSYPLLLWDYMLDAFPRSEEDRVSNLHTFKGLSACP